MAEREARRGYKRHINPDGSEGGWVSNESKVAATVYIAHDAEVHGRSRIEGNVKLLDKANSTSATIEGNAILRDSASVDHCTIKDEVEIGGRTVIYDNSDKSNIEISGDTKIRNIKISAGDGRHIRLRGGRWELPDDVPEFFSGSPVLNFDGSSYDQNGLVTVDRVWAQFGSREPTYKFAGDAELCRLVDFTAPKHLIERIEAYEAKQNSFVNEVAESREKRARGRS